MLDLASAPIPSVADCQTMGRHLDKHSVRTGCADSDVARMIARIPMSALQ